MTVPIFGCLGDFYGRRCFVLVSTILFSLSPAGRELVEVTLPRCRRLVEAMLQDFSDQNLSQLITLLGNWESTLLKAGDKDVH